MMCQKLPKSKKITCPLNNYQAKIHRRVTQFMNYHKIYHFQLVLVDLTWQTEVSWNENHHKLVN